MRQSQASHHIPELSLSLKSASLTFFALFMLTIPAHAEPTIIYASSGIEQLKLDSQTQQQEIADLELEVLQLEIENEDQDQ